MGGWIDAIASKVSVIAPVVGGLLGTPASGVILGMLGSLFGVNSGDVEKIAHAISSDPEADAKLKKLEFDHSETLVKLAAENYAVEVDDRKNARQREINLQDWVPTILAIGFLINYAVIQFYCVTHNDSANDIISARFQDVLIMIISYYFGSAHKENINRP